MRRLWKKLMHTRLGFTLMECVLATALLGAGSTMVMSMVTMGYAYVQRSRSLDQVASVAQEKMAIFADGTTVTEGLKNYSTDSVINYGYSNNIKMWVSYEIRYSGVSTPDVVTPTKFDFVAAIVVDNKDNKVVYYEVSPTDGKIKALYSEKK